MSKTEKTKKLSKLAKSYNYLTLFNMIQLLKMYLICNRNELTDLIQPNSVPKLRNQCQIFIKNIFNQIIWLSLSLCTATKFAYKLKTAYSFK